MVLYLCQESCAHPDCRGIHRCSFSPHTYPRLSGYHHSSVFKCIRTESHVRPSPQHSPIVCVILSAFPLLIAFRHALFLFSSAQAFSQILQVAPVHNWSFPVLQRPRLQPFPDFLSSFRYVELSLRYFVPILREFASGRLRIPYCQSGGLIRADRLPVEVLAGDLGSRSAVTTAVSGLGSACLPAHHYRQVLPYSRLYIDCHSEFTWVGGRERA